ncbi:MAG: DUF3604 domain-containing protein [Myxococcales bacterium]|jgi:hypothetical protein
MMKRLGLLLLVLGVGCSQDATEQPCSGTQCVEPQCDDFDPGLRLLWGDLHVHTRISFDAYFFNSLNGPEEAYRFAKGDPASLVCDDPDTACRTLELDRSLDFTAVTEHAEFLGAFSTACEGSTPDPACGPVGTLIRGSVAQFIQGNNPIDADLVESLFSSLPDPDTIWANIQAVTEAQNDPCNFTTLHAYEYSPLISGSSMHRNVFFLGDVRPTHPISLFDTESEWELFDSLEATCGDVEGCDYLTIPHNSNLADGRMFLPIGTPFASAGRNNQPLTAEDAALRAKSDRMLEIIQLKGQSECMAGFDFDGLGADETDAACYFEQNKPVCTGAPEDSPRCRPVEEALCTSVTGDPNASSEPDDCSSPRDFARGALGEGIRARASLGVNPYQVGFVGSTDTHNGTPGAVDEGDFNGHGGVIDADPANRHGEWSCAIDDPNCIDRVFERSVAFSNNPGGLTAVWAEENTRDAIFAALKARRAYATSGPRIEVRAYGRRAPFADDFCAQLQAGETPVEQGEVDAVPMGSVLSTDGGAPSFAVWALQDAGGNVPGAPLERIQIVKGWVNAAGEAQTKVFDVAGAADGPMPAADCSITTTARPEQLCTTWTDPEFEAGRDAYYYARVLEQPTCRWNTRQCLSMGVDCAQLSPADGTFSSDSGWAGWEGCCDIEGAPGSFTGSHRFDVIRERAWTSPIWYEAN